MFDEKMSFFSLESSETCHKKMSSKTRLIFFFRRRNFSNFIFGRTHNCFWKCLNFFWKLFFFNLNILGKNSLKKVFALDSGICILLTKNSPKKKNLSKSEQKIYIRRRNFYIFFYPWLFWKCWKSIFFWKPIFISF